MAMTYALVNLLKKKCHSGMFDVKFCLHTLVNLWNKKSDNGKFSGKFYVNMYAVHSHCACV